MTENSKLVFMMTGGVIDCHSGANTLYSPIRVIIGKYEIDQDIQLSCSSWLNPQEWGGV